MSDGNDGLLSDEQIAVARDTVDYPHLRGADTYRAVAAAQHAATLAAFGLAVECQGCLAAECPHWAGTSNRVPGDKCGGTGKRWLTAREVAEVLRTVIMDTGVESDTRNPAHIRAILAGLAAQPVARDGGR